MAVGRPPLSDAINGAGNRIGNVWAKWLSNFSAAYDKHIAAYDKHTTTAASADLGHVKKATAVTDAVASAVAIAAALPAAAPAGGTGDVAGAWDTAANRDKAIDTINGLRTLANELKTDVGTLVTDVNAIKDQLNDLLAKMRTAGQLTS